MDRNETQLRLAVCTHNEGCDDLELRKIYRVLPDESAAREGHIRVMDDSGEDYLYPEEYFIVLELPHDVEQAILVAS